MERDNEAIELQFVAGQREPPAGHYCIARRAFKEFKVRLGERHQSCSLSLLECVSLPGHHQYAAGGIRLGEVDLGGFVLLEMKSSEYFVAFAG